MIPRKYVVVFQATASVLLGVTVSGLTLTALTSLSASPHRTSSTVPSADKSQHSSPTVSQPIQNSTTSTQTVSRPQQPANQTHNQVHKSGTPSNPKPQSGTTAHSPHEITNREQPVSKPHIVKSVAKPQARPATARIPSRTVLGYAPSYAAGRNQRDLQSHYSSYREIADWSYTVSATGAVTGSPQRTVVNLARSKHMNVYAAVSNDYSENIMNSILTNSSAMHTFTDSMTAIAVRNGYAGVNLDLENIPAADKGKFTQLVQGLGRTLHSHGKLLTVTVPAETSTGTGYDLRGLSQASDGIIVMAYDYTFTNQPAGAIAPLWWVQKVVSYNLTQVPASKLILGLGVYGYDWSSGSVKAITEVEADGKVSQSGVTSHWDTQDQTEWYTYSGSAGTHTVYYDDARTIALELNIAKQRGLRGVALWPMGGEDSSVDDALAGFAR